jgi:tRNA-specific 2-thiouridylase
LATGHYAKVNEENGRFLLKKALDSEKDQSYYLYGLSQEQLKHIKFPLGDFTKREVREIARGRGFANAEKPESQDICFIPDGGYAAFLEKSHTFEPGDFLDIKGNKLGRHKGLARYTVGQRKGLGIAWSSPLYVREKDAVANTIILCENDGLFSDRLEAYDCNWIVPVSDEPFRGKARIRYRQKEQWATVSPAPGNTAKIVFDEPQRAIAKGQHVVVYNGDIVVGGGVIA